MDKQIEEAVEILENLADASPAAEIEITLEDKNALICAISIIKLFLSVKGVPKKIPIPSEPLSPFQAGKVEGYNLCHDEFTAWLAGRMEGIEDIITNSHLSKMVGDRYIKNHKGAEFGVTLWGKAIDELATAIKTMILGEK